MQTYVGNHRDNQRRDGAAIIASILRSARLIGAGAPPSRKSDSIARPVCAGSAVHSYVYLGARKIPWDTVRVHLRAALELERPHGERSPNARYLAEYLHAERPTLLHYILARPKLLQIWHALKHQAQ